MTISGFSFARNADKLYYPIKESILSILDIVDEFVLAIGDNDKDDKTLEIVKSIQSDKIKIIRTEWDINKYPQNSILAQQTDIAKEACKGDWLFYLQSDEAIHEDGLDLIVQNCKNELGNNKVDGFVLPYLHFWGDYQHYFKSDHCWYPREVRIIRNNPEIHSWRDAQSFRKIRNFDRSKYLTTEDTKKINVKYIDTPVYHYGWVRPPHIIKAKQQHFITNYAGTKKQLDLNSSRQKNMFDFGPLDQRDFFEGTHPKVMQERIKELNWHEHLQMSGDIKDRPKYKHERLKYKIITSIENNLLDGKKIGGFRCYKIIK